MHDLELGVERDRYTVNQCERKLTVIV